MPLAVVRKCGRCGKPEGGRVKLITIGEVIGAAAPIDWDDVAGVQIDSKPDPLWSEAYCRGRTCIGAATLQLALYNLYTKYHTGRGIRQGGIRKRVRAVEPKPSKGVA